MIQVIVQVSCISSEYIQNKLHFLNLITLTFFIVIISTLGYFVILLGVDVTK